MFDEAIVVKENFYGEKKAIQIWDIDVGNIVIQKLIKTKANYKTKYWIFR